MKLLTKAQTTKLIANGKTNRATIDLDGNVSDLEPVVKLFSPWGSATWLISEIDAQDGDMMFGLCDLGMGEPELGYVSLSELQSVKGPFGLKIERDLNWKADKTLSEYVAEAREEGRIVA